MQIVRYDVLYNPIAVPAVFLPVYGLPNYQWPWLMNYQNNSILATIQNMALNLGLDGPSILKFLLSWTMFVMDARWA